VRVVGAALDGRPVGTLGRVHSVHELRPIQAAPDPRRVWRVTVDWPDGGSGRLDLAEPAQYRGGVHGARHMLALWAAQSPGIELVAHGSPGPLFERGLA